MRTRAGVMFAIACCAVPFATHAARQAAESTLPTSASGHGSIAYSARGSDSEDGVGFLHFNVQRQEGGIQGTLLFAAEDHHEYPHIIVRVPAIDTATFEARQVTMTAKGMLHDEEVTVNVRAFDGNGTEQADYFSIRCVNAAGEVVLQAEGDLTSGNIVVGTAS